MIVWKLDGVMRERGIKGRELARRLDIGENYLSRVRHDAPERLSLDLLDALCRELDCGIADLLEFKAAKRVRKAKDTPNRQASPVHPEQVGDSAFFADVLAPLMAEMGEDAGALAGAMGEPPPAPPAEGTAEPNPATAVVVRGNALSAKLARLRKLRGE